MRRLIVHALMASVVIGSLTIAAERPAAADTVCQVTDPETGVCVIWVEVPGDPGEPGEPGDDGPKDTGSGASCYWDGTDQGVSKPPPGPVPCSSEYGYWSNAYNCYIQLADPQPPASDPAWQGHEPGDGAVYQCYQPQTDILILVWAQDPPPNSGTGPTPREVAEIAIDQMGLRAIDIGIVPEPGPDSVGLVGMPVWMWANNPNSHTYGPISASASAGGITITATARVHAITWDMDDGTKIICHGPGMPYKAAYGHKASPECGHTYTTSSSSKPDGRFVVTATSDWVVTWQGAGQSGTIRLNGLQRSVQVAVGEAQVLVQ
jgi:hypothetical protein